MPAPQLIFRVTPEVMTQLDALAYRQDMNRSELARVAIELFLESNPVAPEDLEALADREARRKEKAARFSRPDGLLGSLRRRRDSNP